MGEGKTTVISPLLALLLADGSQLLMQIVPAPLLAFSLGVLRSVFGSGALRKPVWTFAFDRRAQVTWLGLGLGLAITLTLTLTLTLNLTR